jgi:hypothetical protein
MAKKKNISLSNIVSAADIQKKRQNLSLDIENINNQQSKEVNGSAEKVETEKTTEITNKENSNKLEGKQSSQLTKNSKKTKIILSLGENNNNNEPRTMFQIGVSFDKKIEAIRDAIARTTGTKVYKKQVSENILTYFFENHLDEIKEFIANSKDQDDAF